MGTTQKDSLSRRIAAYETRFDSKDRNSGLWTLLAHARQEWSHGCFDICACDLDEIDLMLALKASA